jgi:disulfide bond formation protein DsbB
MVFAGLVTVSLSLLAAGLVIGEFARLNPCHLCIFQRLLYMVLAFFALCGVLLPGWRRVWCVLSGLTAVGGVIAAVQQSWMQYAPQLVNECGFGDPTLVERIVNWLGTQWPSMFMVTGFCTTKDWIFLGLSMANWSILCFLLLFVVTVWLLFRREADSMASRR